MRILHTSDWHLGKSLEGHSRISEQEEFIDELVVIADRERIDLIIVVGDIYDTFNPPSSAEQLFYSAMRRLTNGGKRPVLIIAGNHDNPERLTAASPLAYEWGIILLGTAKSVASCGTYSNYSISRAGEGFIELLIGSEKLVAITLPYPSEKRINEIIMDAGDEKSMQKSYSDKVGELFLKLSKNYRENTINIAVGHFYIKSGEISDSERDISIGGVYAVDISMLPKAQYIAMGHLHRPQKIKGSSDNVYYSGSPVQYSKSEITYAKCVNIVDVSAGEEAEVTTVLLRCYKPIEVIRFSSLEEALDKLNLITEDKWVYLEIKSDRPVNQWELKTIRQSSRFIVEIKIIIEGETENAIEEDQDDPTILEAFEIFYKDNRGASPSDDIKKLFISLLDEEEENETD